MKPENMKHACAIVRRIEHIDEILKALEVAKCHKDSKLELSFEVGDPFLSPTSVVVLNRLFSESNNELEDNAHLIECIKNHFKDVRLRLYRTLELL